MASTVFGVNRVGSCIQPCPVTKPEIGPHWIEIQLFGEDGNPLASEEYLIQLPNGQPAGGCLDEDGLARVDNIAVAGVCKVSFPFLDKDAWLRDGASSNPHVDQRTVVPHEVSDGESLANVAFKLGFFPGTIWDHPSNAKLRDLRNDGYVLQPGDILQVVELDPRVEPCATDARYRFRRKGVPARLRVRFLTAEGKPRAGQAYQLRIGEQERSGSTDSTGLLLEWVSPGVDQVVVSFETEEEIEEFELQVHHLLPAANQEGALQRLENLGYLSPNLRDADEVRRALARFQRNSGLNLTGNLDGPTRRRLLQSHNC